MDYIVLLGLLAGFLTTVSFIPQVLKAWKTKSTRDVSLGMFLMLTIGIFLWAAYGFLINSFPVIAANVVSLAFAIVILFLKIKYK